MVASSVAKTSASDKEIADAARKLMVLLFGTSAPVAPKVTKAAVVDGDEDEEIDDVEEDEDDDEELDALDRSETEALSIKELRETAKKYGLTVTKKSEILAGLEEFFDDAAEEAEEDEDDEEAEEEEGEVTREDLAELSLKELREEAKAAGLSAADTRGKDQDALIDLILGEDEGDDDEADEEEDDEEEEEVEELDEESLNAMSLGELRELAKEIGVTVKIPVTAKTETKKKKVFVEAILDSAEEE